MTEPAPMVGANEDTITEGGTVFVCAVVVAGNGPGTDVDRTADDGVTDIAQMIDFAAFADGCCFGFDEVANAHTFIKHGFGAQTGKGTDLRIGTNAAMFEARMTVHTRTRADIAVIEHTAAFDIDVVTETDRTLDDNICLNDHITPGADCAVNVDTRRVNQRNARI